MNRINTFDELPKMIEYETVGKVLYFYPTIIKWENVGLDNAYYAMYSRYYKRSGNINAQQVLFCVSAGSFQKVIDRFIEEYNIQQNNIDNRVWKGDRPKIIDLMNNSVDGYLMARNANRPKL